MQNIFVGRAGAIPKELGELTALTKLDLGFSGLTGTSVRCWVYTLNSVDTFQHRELMKLSGDGQTLPLLWKMFLEGRDRCQGFTMLPKQRFLAPDSCT